MLDCGRSVVCLFFFFKQKTAYDMRISDWSSDVCSSDLLSFTGHNSAPRLSPLRNGATPYAPAPDCRPASDHDVGYARGGPRAGDGRGGSGGAARRTRDVRSEEHTSELQSLMRNSYAVFCLKKKKQY